MKQFHVYEDWTLENPPRCFYVGKGDSDRVIKLRRNGDHSVVTSQYGQNRVVVLSTYDEVEALNLERKLIAERHTYLKDPIYNGIGCNKTLGGQGNSGRIVSEETCRKISESKKGKHPNKVWTKEEREATSKRMSMLHHGKTLSEEHRQVLRDRMANEEIRSNMIKKVTSAVRAKYEEPGFHEHIVETRVRGEMHGSAILTENDVRAIRQEWSAIDHSKRGVQKEFCNRWGNLKQVTPMSIYDILIRNTWKHVED